MSEIHKKTSELNVEFSFSNLSTWGALHSKSYSSQMYGQMCVFFFSGNFFENVSNKGSRKNLISTYFSYKNGRIHTQRKRIQCESVYHIIRTNMINLSSGPLSSLRARQKRLTPDLLKNSQKTNISKEKIRFELISRQKLGHSSSIWSRIPYR